MSTATAVPTVRAWRRRARRARREHHDRSWRQVASDLYTLLWFLVIYGTALVSEVRRHLEAPSAAAGALERHWLGVAALMGGAGLAWRALRAVGPLVTTAAEQSWVVSSPIDRRGWLLPRFGGMLVAGAAAGALAGATVVLLGLGTGFASAALAGTGFGIALPACAVVPQGRRGGSGWAAWPAPVLLGLGGLTAVAVIGAHQAGSRLPPPIAGSGLAIIAVGAGLAIASAGLAFRTLPDLDRASLGSGARLAAAVVTSAIWLDPTVLSGVLEMRRWRRVGRVRSRRLPRAARGVPDRVWALLQSELLRTARRPAALATVAGLLLAQYALAVAAPSLAGVSRVILAYVAAGRLMSGLRRVAGSPGLRRALGGRELTLRGVHVVVPAVGTALWWAATGPAGGGVGGAVGITLLAAVVAAAYRAATRGPMAYGGTVIETPFGLLPVELAVQLARGPDILGVAILVQVLLG